MRTVLNANWSEQDAHGPVDGCDVGHQQNNGLDEHCTLKIDQLLS